MGRALAPGDVDGWTDALAELLDDDRAYAAARTAVEAAQDELSWSRVGEPLADLIDRVASAPRRRSSERGVLLRAGATLARSSLDRRGAAGDPRGRSAGDLRRRSPLDGCLGWTAW